VLFGTPQSKVGRFGKADRKFILEQLQDTLMAHMEEHKARP
jgi:hypothetical protein